MGHFTCFTGNVVIYPPSSFAVVVVVVVGGGAAGGVSWKVVSITSIVVMCCRTRPGGLVWRALHLVHGPWSLFALPFALVATGPAQEQTSTGAQEADSEGTSLRPRDVPTLPGYLN